MFETVRLPICLLEGVVTRSDCTDYAIQVSVYRDLGAMEQCDNGLYDWFQAAKV